ncbi:MAG: hypothetical protein H8E38_00140 [SAR324 cluster bacterium]|nr:hypothetical protein [SAR324 cluster bacterium]
MGESQNVWDIFSILYFKTGFMFQFRSSGQLRPIWLEPKYFYSFEQYKDKENEMSKKQNNPLSSLNLDAKTLNAVRVLTESGLLEPLLIEMVEALEAEEYQNSVEPKRKYDPVKEDLIRQGLSPEEAEKWLQMS